MRPGPWARQLLDRSGAGSPFEPDVGRGSHLAPADEPPRCSGVKRDYLPRAYNSYFFEPRSPRDVMASFSGIRPLIRSAADPSRVSRESALERTGRLITIFGGKRTSAHALGERVAAALSD